MDIVETTVAHINVSPANSRESALVSLTSGQAGLLPHVSRQGLDGGREMGAGNR